MEQSYPVSAGRKRGKVEPAKRVCCRTVGRSLENDLGPRERTRAQTVEHDTGDRITGRLRLRDNGAEQQRCHQAGPEFHATIIGRCPPAETFTCCLASSSSPG